jgi:hypothetical protein
VRLGCSQWRLCVRRVNWKIGEHDSIGEVDCSADICPSQRRLVLCDISGIRWDGKADVGVQYALNRL